MGDPEKLNLCFCLKFLRKKPQKSREARCKTSHEKKKKADSLDSILDFFALPWLWLITMKRLSRSQIFNLCLQKSISLVADETGLTIYKIRKACEAHARATNSAWPLTAHRRRQRSGRLKVARQRAPAAYRLRAAGHSLHEIMGLLDCWGKVTEAQLAAAMRRWAACRGAPWPLHSAKAKAAAVAMGLGAKRKLPNRIAFPRAGIVGHDDAPMGQGAGT